MGKKESFLVPFIKEGLERKKYGADLDYVDVTSDVFRMVLPHILKLKDHQGTANLLKDWNMRKKRRGEFDYSKSKKRIKSALVRSPYFEKQEVNAYAVTYRILSSSEVKSKKLKKKSNSPNYKDPSSVESGYHSYAEASATTDLENSGREHSLGEPSTSYALETSNVIESDSCHFGSMHDGTAENIGDSTNASMDETDSNDLGKKLKKISNSPDYTESLSVECGYFSYDEPSATTDLANNERDHSVEEPSSSNALQTSNVIEGDSHNFGTTETIGNFTNGSIEETNSGDLEVLEYLYDGVLPECISEFSGSGRENSVVHSSSDVFQHGVGSSVLNENDSSISNADGNFDSGSGRTVTHAADLADGSVDITNLMHFDIEGVHSMEVSSLSDALNVNKNDSNILYQNSNSVSHRATMNAGYMADGSMDRTDIEGEHSMEVSSLSDALNVNENDSNILYQNSNSVSHRAVAGYMADGSMERTEPNVNGCPIIYSFKSEQVLNKTILIVCEPKYNSTSGERCAIYEYGFTVTMDLHQRIEKYQILTSRFEDNHLILFLTPRENAVGVF